MASLSSHQATTTPSQIMRRARAIDSEIRRLARKSRRTTAQICLQLHQVLEEGLYAQLGHESILSYAKHVLGWSGVKTRAALVVTSRPELSCLQAVFQGGELSLSKAAEVARVATVHDEFDWIALAKESTLEGLRLRARGLPPASRRWFLIPDVDLPVVESALVRAGAGSGLTRGQALVQICRRYNDVESGGGAEDGDGELAPLPTASEAGPAPAEPPASQALLEGAPEVSACTQGGAVSREEQPRAGSAAPACAPPPLAQRTPHCDIDAAFLDSQVLAELDGEIEAPEVAQPSSVARAARARGADSA